MRNNKTLLVAEYILKKAQDSNRPITNKVLQKLLYYSQAWSLVLKNKKLFNDDIEAWVHGPAIPVVYRAYNQFSYSPITDKIIKTDFEPLTSSELELIDEVWNIYGEFDGDYLETLTHREAPWLNARNGLEPFESSHKKISLTDMKNYYGKRLQEAQSAA